jgi:hypothetical protein
VQSVLGWRLLLIRVGVRLEVRLDLVAIACWRLDGKVIFIAVVVVVIIVVAVCCAAAPGQSRVVEADAVLAGGCKIATSTSSAEASCVGRTAAWRVVAGRRTGAGRATEDVAATFEGLEASATTSTAATPA